MENWAAALALRPAHIAPAAWEAACSAGAEQERRKAVLVERRREALGLACYLAGADEWSDLWKDLPESLREEYRAIACDTYAVSSISWSPARRNIVIEYTTDEDTYQAIRQARPPDLAPRVGDLRQPVRADVGSPIDALRSMAGTCA